MDTKVITVIATGKKRLDVLSRITSLFMQRHLPVESVSLKSSENGDGLYMVSLSSSEEVIQHIVNQIKNIEEINNVEYKY